MTPHILSNIPLNDKNWFQTGGTSRFFTEPQTVAEFAAALKHAHEHNLDTFVLGQGANILISDDGFDGLVIRPKIETIVHENALDGTVHLTAGAGVTMAALINYCFNHNLIGLEEFSGIPGTVGGSVYINLHYFQFLLSQFIVQAQVIDATSGIIETVSPEWFEFGYDHSKLFAKKHYLVNATFKVKQTNDLEIAFARGRAHEIIRHRNARYPKTHTCGSFFRNFHDYEVSLTIPGSNKKMIFAAYYLDKAGVKGALSVGDAIVSHQHANMLVNKGTATSSDIIELACRMQELVYNQFGVMLQPECQLVGFKKYPLL